MKRLLIIGAGGHGKVVAEAAHSMGYWNSIAFLDVRYPAIKEVLGLPVLGVVEKAYDFLNKYTEAVVAVGDGATRKDIIDYLLGLGFFLPVIIHSSACVSPSATVNKGSVILAHAVINASSIIGRGCIINSSAVIEHDCFLKKGVHVCPQATLAGNVTIGDLSWIGVGSTIIQSIDIGENVMVGAGAVVIRNVQSNTTVMGIPARER